MLVVKIGIYIVMGIIGSIFLTDYITNKVSQLKRFHIGRWDSEKEWKKSVRDRAVKWVNHTPIVKKSDNYQYILLDIWKGKYKSDTLQSWQKAGLIIGLVNYKSDAVTNALNSWKKRTFATDGSWNRCIDKVDFAMLGYAALLIEKNPQKIKPAMDSVIDIIKENICSDGMISYSQGKKSATRFVDTLGMVCPFLTRYGRVYEKKEYIDLAIYQIKKFQEIGLFPGSQLPCHAISVDEKKPLGIYGWGRGVVWYTIALIDTFRELPEGSEKEEIKRLIFEAAEEYKKYQKEDGGFYTILQGEGQYDSSATAGMAYYYRCCAKIFNSIEYQGVADKCKKRLIKVTLKNGAIDQCQGDTHGIGIFSQVFDIMPFIQGLCLRAIEEE